MKSEILSVDTAKKLADYEILKSQKDYYKNEYDLIVIELKKKNNEIKRLMKIISDMKGGK